MNLLDEVDKIKKDGYSEANAEAKLCQDIIRCEEENLDEIDDKLIQVAEKFGVEPRKLLSHVLEYELTW